MRAGNAGNAGNANSISDTDSLMAGVLDNLKASWYTKEGYSIATLCGTVSSSVCQACFAGLRSVKECLVPLFCPKPQARVETKFYTVFYRNRTATHSELIVPLLSRHEQNSQHRKPVEESGDEDYMNAELFAEFSESDFLVDGKPWRLPSLSPVPYESIPDEVFSQYFGNEEEQY